MPTVTYEYVAAFDPATYRPAFDPTGTLPANRVSGEKHTLTPANGRDFHFVVPLLGPFFAYAGALSVVHQGVTGPARTLVEGVDYNTAFQFIGASRACAKPVYGGIVFMNPELAGVVTLAYRTIGGNWVLSQPEINRILADTILNPRVTAWEQVVNRPVTFPVIDHEWNLDDLVGAKEVVDEIRALGTIISNRPTGGVSIAFQAHLDDLDNPHETSKDQLNLGNVENFPVASSLEAQQGTATNRYMTPAAVLAAIQANAVTSVGGKTGEVTLTGQDVGLGLVENLPVITAQEIDAGAPLHVYLTHDMMLRYIGNLDILPAYLISTSATTVNEGASLTYTVNTVNVANGTVLYWSLGGQGVDGGDFTVPALSGSFTVTSSQASLVKVLVNDALTEGAETLIFTVRTGSAAGPSVGVNSAVSISDTSVLATYALSPSVASVNEGGSVVYTVSTSDVPNGTTLYWSTAGTGVNAGDFTDNVATGSVQISNDSASFTRTLKSDTSSEGTETFTVSLRRTSVSGPIVATAATVTVSDTSTTPTTPMYSISPSVSSTNESGLGNAVTFTIDTLNVPNGTTVYYSLVGGVSAADFTDGSLTGAVTVNNSGAASFTKTLTADALTEGTENFIAQLHLGSATGTMVAQSTAVAVNDTSLSPAPSYSITPPGSSVNEGNTIVFSVSTSNLVSGTTLYWTTSGAGLSAADFTDGILSAALIVNNNAAVISRTLVNDATTEGSEPFTISLRTGSTSGPVVATSPSVTVNDTSVTNPPNGTLLSTSCSGTTKMGLYANGTGGTYSQTIETNSPDCGYVPPAHPANGTELSRACSGTTMVGTYANGTGGTYTADIATNSPDCGYVPPTPAGTELSRACSGTTLVGTYANGNYGSYQAVIQENSPTCGYVAPTPYGTLLSTYCAGTTLMGNYANGNYGTYQQAIAYNHTDCGYIAPRFYAFNSSGTFTVPAGVSAMTVLVVAGGGGGGGDGGAAVEGGAGGGAGGVVYTTAYVSPGQQIGVTIGAGGDRGYAGNDTAFGVIVAKGGGRGGNGYEWTYFAESYTYDKNGGVTSYTPAYYDWAISYSGGNGGSSGGRCPFFNQGAVGEPVVGQGNYGGNGAENNYSGGGGGIGGGASGDNGVQGGAGGQFTMGTQVPYVAGGGGGGGLRGQGQGGYGGGHGAVGDGPWGNSGATNTGGGGGGGAFHGLGGLGGSGVVYIYIPGN